MPRKKRDIGAIRSVDLVAQVELDRRSRHSQRRNQRPRRHGEDREGFSDEEEDGAEADFHNVCPCRKCARLPRPTVRFMSVIGHHIQAHGTAPTYEVLLLVFCSLK